MRIEKKLELLESEKTCWYLQEWRKPITVKCRILNCVSCGRVAYRGDQAKCVIDVYTLTSAQHSNIIVLKARISICMQTLQYPTIGRVRQDVHLHKLLQSILNLCNTANVRTSLLKGWFRLETYLVPRLRDIILEMLNLLSYFCYYFKN